MILTSAFNIFSLIAIFMQLLHVSYGRLRNNKATCTKPDATFKRVEETRFYMHNKETQTFEKAKETCENIKPKGNFKLATINTIEEDAEIGRFLERFFVKNAGRNHRFWIAFKYDPEGKTYRSAYTNQSIVYHNLHEKYAHPLGRVPGCMTVALPYPKKNIYGWGYTWDPVPCDSKHYAFCETNQRGCDNFKYYDATAARYSSIFPFSERRFTLTWERLGYEEAEIFCKDRALDLYKPSNADTCLFTILNDHRPDVTKMHFWAARPRSPDRSEPKLCPAAVLAYETHNACNCKWRYIVTAAADCKLKNAVICEAPMRKKDLVQIHEKCLYENELVLIDEKKDFHRSSDKADYDTAEAECRKHNFQIVTQEQIELIKWRYEYDETETYWTYNNNTDTTEDDACYTSRYDLRHNQIYKFERASCSTMNFFLCGILQDIKRGSGRSFPTLQKPKSLNNTLFDSSSEEDISFGPQSQYVVGETKMDYFDAEKECKANGMKVVDLSNKESQQFLQDLIEEFKRPFWIRNEYPHVPKNHGEDGYHNHGNHHHHRKGKKKHSECLAINEHGKIESFYCRAKLKFACEY